MSALDGYWAAYDATLARVRSERPSTFAELKAILDGFHHGALQDGGAQAFFPSQSADEELWEALVDAGWSVEFGEASYVYEAQHPSGARFEFVEGDLYDRTPPPAAEAAAAAPDPDRCSECGEAIDEAAVGFEAGGYGMCGSCLHNAVRSGWEPGA